MPQRHPQPAFGFILLITLLGLTLTISPVLAHANTNGSLDPTFGVNGKTTTDFGGYEEGHAVAYQSDGKILMAGYAAGANDDDFALVRYTSDGNLDTTFGANGIVRTDLGNYDYGYAMAIASDGKIVVAGYSGSDNVDFAIVRYNSDGTLDTTFDQDGKVTTDLGSNDYGRALALQADGKIIVAGYSGSDNVDFALVRYNNDGALDQTFAQTGQVTTDFGGEDNGLAVALQTDGKILVVGSSGNNDDDFALARYNSDGTLDATFHQTGKVTSNLGGNDYGYALTLQSDGKILVAGSSSTDFALARYNSDGGLDANFGNSGFIITHWGSNEYGYALTIDHEGKLLVAGSSGSDFALARYSADGHLDANFGNNGVVTTDFGNQDAGVALTLQSEDKLIIAGYSSGNFALARYMLTGSTPATGTPATSTPTNTPLATATATNTPTPTATPEVALSPNSTLAQPGQTSSLTYQAPDGSGITLQVPPDAVHDPTTLVYQANSTTTTPTAYQFIGHAFNLTAYQNNTPLAHFTFDQPITVTLYYTEADSAGQDENQFQLLTFNATTGQWSTDGITVIARHPEENYLVVTIAHFTTFALTSPPHQLFIPLARRG